MKSVLEDINTCPMNIYDTDKPISIGHGEIKSVMHRIKYQANVCKEFACKNLKKKKNFVSNKNSDKHQALWYGPVNYKYGNYKELKATPLPEYLKEIAEYVSLKINEDKDYFNSVYINRYDNAGIGKHHDNDSIFKKDKSWDGGKEIIVAVLSFGASADISLYRGKGKNPLDVTRVRNNTMYAMGKDVQNKYLHKVGASNGVRYSLTFRHCVSGSVG